MIYKDGELSIIMSHSINSNVQLPFAICETKDADIILEKIRENGGSDIKFSFTPMPIAKLAEYNILELDGVGL